MPLERNLGANAAPGSQRSLVLRSRRSWWLAVGLGLCLAVAGGLYWHLQSLLRHNAVLDLRSLYKSLEEFKQRHGRYPSTQEGFSPLVADTLLRAAPKDPWGTDYTYELTDSKPRVTSLGSDHRPGGFLWGRDVVIEDERP